MSDSHQPEARKVPEPTLAGMVAEFATPHDLIVASRKVREAGYQKFDAHSPFPIHGIDDAVGIRMTRLPWLTLAAAAAGCTIAIVMQFYLNGVDYPLIISAKPLFSIPASMPIVFELGVLLAAFTTVIGMLALNGLPRFAHPLLSVNQTTGVTQDRFFISVDSRDGKFSLGETRSFLESIGGSQIEAYYINRAQAAFPKILIFLAVIVACALTIPPMWVAKQRLIDKRNPKIHLFQDMDFQPKFKTQKPNRFFADGEASRPQLGGTIPRGSLEDNDPLYVGLDVDDGRLEQLLAAAAQPAVVTPAPADNAAAPTGEAKDPLDELPWVKTSPVPMTAATLKRGQERYNIHCAICHGLAGDGDGLATRRAMELEQGTWVKPVSYHTDLLRHQPIGRLFHSITNGVRKMPAMGDVVTVEDRWAILMYLRALQRTRTGSEGDVPPNLLPELKEVALQ